MKSCKQCGDCCRDIELPLGKIFDEDDIRWIEYHNLKVVEKNGVQWVKINHPCSKLKDNRCSIHKDRPDICKLYVCQKLLSPVPPTEESNPELINAYWNL